MPSLLAAAQARRNGGADVYQRVARRLIPLLLLCYIVAMVDRLNVGFAKLQFQTDLHFDEAVFGTAAGVLYVGYILFEVPSNLVLQRTGLRLTLLRIMTLWGLFTMVMAFATARWGFYATRFMIGAAEAGFFPGVLYFFTLWFPNSWRARIFSIFALGVPLSGIVAAPTSSWIMVHLNGIMGLRGWQWLFLLEGAPAICLGAIAYLYLPNRPAEARFLSVDEKATIENDLAADGAQASGATTFATALRNPKVYGLAFVYFAFFSTQSILLLWMPTLLKRAGVADLAEIGWRTALIFAAGAVGMITVGWNSDRNGERRVHLVSCAVVASLALYALPLAAHSPQGATVLLAFASAAIFAFLSLFWTVPTAILGQGARAGGVAFVSSIGALGSVLSPIFLGWTQVLTGSFFGGIAALASMHLASMVVLWLCAPGRSAHGNGAPGPAVPDSAAAF
jgi:sugar phosphate permease